MHSTLVRVQNAFGIFTTVAFVVAALIAASDLFAPRTPRGTLATSNTQVVRGRPHYYSSRKEEYAIIKFSLDADLSSLFTWNTKQVFVYVTAEWPAAGAAGSAPGGENNATAAATGTNEAVIWDSIITSPTADHLANLGPATLKKLRKSAAGKSVDPSRGILSLKSQRPKYQITHPSGKMGATEDVKLRLHYNVQPWVGLLSWDQDADFGLWKRVEGGASEPFALPAVKKKVEEAKAPKVERPSP